jgi:hypothetical protein
MLGRDLSLCRNFVALLVPSRQRLSLYPQPGTLPRAYWLISKEERHRPPLHLLSGLDAVDVFDSWTLAFV